MGRDFIRRHTGREQVSSLGFGLGAKHGNCRGLVRRRYPSLDQTGNPAQGPGQSWRLRYGKNVIETGTNFSLASYRYSTRGFYTLQEALESYGGNSAKYNDHKKSRAELILSQNLWEGGGTLSLSLFNEDYWNDSRRSQSASVGYNNNWQSVSYGFNYTFSQNGFDSNGQRTNVRDHILAFNVSVPLNKWLPGSYATYNMNSSRNGPTSHNLGLSGSALEGNNLNYSLSQGYTGKGEAPMAAFKPTIKAPWLS